MTQYLYHFLTAPYHPKNTIDPEEHAIAVLCTGFLIAHNYRHTIDVDLKTFFHKDDPVRDKEYLFLCADENKGVEWAGHINKVWEEKQRERLQGTMYGFRFEADQFRHQPGAFYRPHDILGSRMNKPDVAWPNFTQPFRYQELHDNSEILVNKRIDLSDVHVIEYKL